MRKEEVRQPSRGLGIRGGRRMGCLGGGRRKGLRRGLSVDQREREEGERFFPGAQSIARNVRKRRVVEKGERAPIRSEVAGKRLFFPAHLLNVSPSHSNVPSTTPANMRTNIVRII
jgi:hypothetical protein